MTKKHKSTRAKSNSSSKNLLGFFLAILLLAGGVFVWFYATDPNHFPIKTVRVESPFIHTKQAAIQAELKPYLHEGFFAVNVGDLQQLLMQDPWVANASIRRIFPGTLVVRIQEQQAQALWGDKSVLNAKGQIFSPPANTIPTNLPMLYGPADEIAAVWAMYGKMNQILAPLKLSITELELNARGAYRLRLSNGVRLILGRLHPVQRIERYVAVYAQVFANKSAPVSVDLRYNNGLAVNWGNNSNSSTQSADKITTNR